MKSLTNLKVNKQKTDRFGAIQGNVDGRGRPVGVVGGISFLAGFVALTVDLTKNELEHGTNVHTFINRVKIGFQIDEFVKLEPDENV